MDRLYVFRNKSLNCLKLFQPVAFKPGGACTPIATQNTAVKGLSWQSYPRRLARE